MRIVATAICALASLVVALAPPTLALASDLGTASEAGLTELQLTKHEPAAYEYGRGSSPCRFDPREQNHHLTDADVGFSSVSRSYVMAIRVDVGPFDQHMHHFRFFPDDDRKLEVGTYVDTQCTLDPDSSYNDLEISVSIDPFNRIRANYLKPCFEGGFRILEVEYGDDSVLERLAVDFQYRGVGVMGDVDGRLRYNASRSFDELDPFDLETALEGNDVRPAHMSVEKTLWASVDFDDLDVCTIAEEADTAQADASAANPWDPNSAEDPGQGRLFCDNGVLACVHLVSSGGALNVSGQVKFVDTESCEAALEQNGIGAFCGSPDLPMVGNPGRALEEDPAPEPEREPESPFEEIPESELPVGPDPEPPLDDPDEFDLVVPELSETERSDLAAGVEETPGDDRATSQDAVDEEVVESPRSYSAEVPDRALPFEWTRVQSDEEGEEAEAVETAQRDVHPEEELDVVDESLAEGSAPDPASFDPVPSDTLRSDRSRAVAAEPSNHLNGRGDPLPTSAERLGSDPIAVSAQPMPSDSEVHGHTSDPATQTAARALSADHAGAEVELAFDSAEVLASLSEIVERARAIYRDWTQAWIQVWIHWL